MFCISIIDCSCECASPNSRPISINNFLKLYKVESQIEISEKHSKWNGNKAKFANTYMYVFTSAMMST